MASQKQIVGGYVPLRRRRLLCVKFIYPQALALEGGGWQRQHAALTTPIKPSYPGPRLEGLGQGFEAGTALCFASCGFQRTDQGARVGGSAGRRSFTVDCDGTQGRDSFLCSSGDDR